MKILIIEDDQRVCRLLRTVISSFGHDVTLCGSAEDALEVYQNGFFPVIISDVGLPGMDGMELCRRIRSMPSGKDSVILIETGLVRPEDINKILDAGADDYLMKPLDMQRLTIRLQIAVKRAMDRLKQRETNRALLQLEKAFRTMQLGVTICDIYGKIIYSNPADAQIHGYTVEELIGKDVGIFAPSHIKRRPMNKEQLKKMRNLARESTNARKDGSLFPAWLISDVVLDEDGEPIAIVTTCDDITDRKQVEEELIETNDALEEANAAKDTFFSIIAHDLRNPLNVIMGYSEIISTKFNNFTIDEIKDYNEIIRTYSHRLYNLLENLLQWAKSQTGKIKYNPERVKFAEIVKNTISISVVAAKVKDISLVTEIDENTYVYADSHMLTTVIRNLLSNAIKFTEPGGEVKIAANDEDNFLMVSVIDTGVGMKKEEMDKLFKIDIHHSTLGTSKEKGTGLGLILCKEFVNKHGGNIWVESETGKGSTFKITLPTVMVDQINL